MRKKEVGFQRVLHRSLMESSNMPLILFLAVFSSLLAPTTSQPDFTCFTCNETHGNYTSSSTFSKNLNILLSTLSSNTQISNGFYQSSVGNNSDRVYGVGVCRGDQSVAECRSCLNDATTRLPGECPTQKEAIGYYYGQCMVRYSDRSIFRLMETSPFCTLYNAEQVSQTDVEKFNQRLVSLMESLRKKAAAGDSDYKYAIGDDNVTASIKIYGLNQCNPDLSPSNCLSCLQKQFSYLQSCCRVNRGAGIYGPSCSVHYENYPIVNSANTVSQSPLPASSTPPSAHARGGRNKAWIIVVLFASFMLLATIGVFYSRRRMKKKQKEIQSRDQMKCVDFLQFEFDAIQLATDNFSDERRLGKSSSGRVYKGVLPSGQEVAVKRLCNTDRDGELTFNTEVMLLANLQHKNLVKLLGFCIEQDLRFLIYEFLPNGSLDRFLHDPVKCANLDWEMRHKIILGIARGLLYLHEDSQLRVIHRDLKTSSILLGVEMNAKITNFSKARKFHADQTRKGTNTIKGTYGYMPPEYVLQGHFSIKSDVFSFGVLVLEIISGQNISSFSDEKSEENLLSFAWRKWSEGTALDMVDQTMQSIKSYTTQILRCINIALLCVQEAPENRPTMSAVVFMLNSNIATIAQPSTPAFIIYSDMHMPSFHYSDQSCQGSVSDASTSQH